MAAHTTTRSFREPNQPLHALHEIFSAVGEADRPFPIFKFPASSFPLLPPPAPALAVQPPGPPTLLGEVGEVLLGEQGRELASTRRTRMPTCGVVKRAVKRAVKLAVKQAFKRAVM